MSTVSPPVRGRTWVFQVTALCIVLGMLLALSLKTQRQSAEEGIPSRLPALTAQFRFIKQQNIDLKKELLDLKVRYGELEKSQAKGLTSTKSLQESLQKARLLAGTAPAHGPGIIIMLSDSPKLNPEETREDIIGDYIIHYYDIMEIVNEVFASGAEAVSVNDQRIVATSSIRCVGAVVLVNSVQVAPPIVIKAIGERAVLEKALELPGGVADNLFLLDMIEITQAKDIVVPAYSGTTRFKFAHPVEDKKKKKG